MSLPFPMPAGPSAGFVREGGRYLRSHWPHLAIAPCLALTAVTLLHELAHCAAVWVQGGTVTGMAFLPGQTSLGHMSYEVPSGSFFVPELVSLAPYAMWIGLAMATAAISVAGFFRQLPFAFASTLFVWLYVVPLLDVAVAVEGWFAGSQNDLRNAIGKPTILDAALVAVLVPVAFAASWVVQRGLYGRDRALSPPAYLFVSAVCVVLLVAAMLAIEVARALT